MDPSMIHVEVDRGEGGAWGRIWGESPVPGLELLTRHPLTP